MTTVVEKAVTITEHRIKIMQAFVEGKKIQYQPVESLEWAPALIPAWNWQFINYRVAPEKTVGYKRYIYKTTSTGARLNVLWEDEQAAQFDITKSPHFVRWLDTEWQYEEV